MSSLMWCGLFGNTPSIIKLDNVKASCKRVAVYCSQIESFCKQLSFIELGLSLIIFLWSSFRCNPFLLNVIIDNPNNREQQKMLQPVFSTALYLRPNETSNYQIWTHVPSLLFFAVCYINIIILTLDVLYSIYLWIKIRKEVLFLHFGSKDIASVEARNVMISLAVAPMSAFCISRYWYFNKYIASNRLNDALETINQLKIFTESNVTDDGNSNDTNDNNENDDDAKTEELEKEKEALYALDNELSKTKPYDMKDMEDVLELCVPTFILWNLNIYLCHAGLVYLGIYVGMFIIIMFLVIWFSFSSNVGMITPLILPLSCVVLDFFCFIFMATLNMIWYSQSIIALLFITPILILSVVSLVWKKNGTKQD